MIKRLQKWKMFRTIRKHRDKKNLVMGMTWYRPEQWHLLREISEDKKILTRPTKSLSWTLKIKSSSLKRKGVAP